MPTRLEELQSLRDLLRDSLNECPPYSRAPLAAQYRATLAEIDDLAGTAAGESKPKNPLDELSRRRKERSA